MLAAETIYLPVLGCFFYFGVHCSCRSFLRKYYSKNLDSAAQYRVSTRVISFVNAFLAVVVSARTMIVCTDILTDEDPYLRLFIKFGLSYFLYDLYVMYIGGKPAAVNPADGNERMTLFRNIVAFCKREASMVIHHIVLTVVGIPMIFLLRNGIGDFFVGCLFFAELSTPFLSIRAILHECKIFSGRLYVGNGLAFIATFFFARVLCIPYLYLTFASYKGISILAVPGSVPMHCNVLSALFMMLQIHWFNVILKNVARRLPSLSIGKYKKLAIKLNGLHKDSDYVKQN